MCVYTRSICKYEYIIQYEQVICSKRRIKTRKYHVAVEAGLQKQSFWIRPYDVAPPADTTGISSSGSVPVFPQSQWYFGFDSKYRYWQCHCVTPIICTFTLYNTMRTYLNMVHYIQFQSLFIGLQIITKVVNNIIILAMCKQLADNMIHCIEYGKCKNLLHL